jgi:hypothetical protein
MWASYFKFAVERNPWDKAISGYYWSHRHRPHPWPTIWDWLTDETRPHKVLGSYDLYSIRGQVAVDQVLRYEVLETEVNEIAKRVGLPNPITLPHAKSNIRTNRRPYAEVLDHRARRHIELVCAREIALLGYTF